MPKQKPESQLIAHVEVELADAFRAQIDKRGHIQKRAMAAAIRLWVDLPVEVQAKLVSESLDSPSLVALVQQIVDDTIEAGRQAGKELQTRQKRKQGQAARAGK